MKKCNHALTYAWLIAIALVMTPVLAATPLSIQQSEKPSLKTTDEGKRVWNLKDVDIRTLVHEVSDATHKNFVIGPNVNAKVTFVTKNALDTNELYHAFLAVLHVYGFSAVPEGKVIKIVLNNDNSHISSPVKQPHVPVPPEGMVVATIRVNNYPVADLVKLLKPMMPKYSYIQAYKPSNDLIIADHASHIDKLRGIIKRLDKPSASNFGIIRLRYATAQDLAKTLSDLFSSTRVSRSTTHHEPLKVVADLRTNSLLVNGGSPEQRHELRAMVRQLDVFDSAKREVTEVFYLKYLPAETFAPILQGLIDSYLAEEDAIKTSKSKSEIASSGNQSLSSGSSNRPSGFNLLNPTANLTGDTSSSSSSSTNATAFSSEGPRSGSAGRNVQWEGSTNSLVITSTVDLMRRLQHTIDKLDIRRPQVLVEVIIAEVAVDKIREWGIELSSGSSLKFNTRFSPTQGLSQIGSGGFASAVASAAEGAAETASGVGTGLSLGLFHNDMLNVLVRAIQGDTDSNILATPNIVTLDNEPALIKVGRKVSFATSRIENNPTGGNPLTSLAREDVGLILSIKPQITPNGSIRLQIQQELSSVIEGSQANREGGNPDTTERFVQTTVMADNGQVIALAGLLQSDWSRAVSKVPLLGDIPGFGALFRSHFHKLRKSNLMIFLRPMILYDKHDSKVMTGGKYEFLRQQQLELEARHDHVITPVLPRLDESDDLPDAFC